MPKLLNVLYQTDNNYAPQTGVSITSLCCNNTDMDEIDIYILDDGINPDNIRRFEQLATDWGRRIHFIDTTAIKEKLISLGVEPFRGTYTTYLKLFALSDLSINSDRILQIDGDTIINQSLDPLLQIDLQGSILAATYECVQNGYKQLIGLKPTDPYYNCGVMLINLPSWQYECCEDQIVSHLKNVRNRYFTVDQDIINVLFSNRITYLPIKYNVNSGFYIYGIDTSFWMYDLNPNVYASKDEIEDAVAHPAINHCMGPMTGRPWEIDNIHPQGPLYDQYLEKSPWRDVPKIQSKTSTLFKLQRAAYTLLPLTLYKRIHKMILTNWLKEQNKRCLEGR